MDADPFPVGTVLNGVKRFVVPIYQRNYAWTAKDELEPFWEQLVNKAEERLAAQRSKFPHYMGALIVIPDGEFAFGQVQTFNVVDGQQRLTTFQIALAAFAGVAREIKAEADRAKEANPEMKAPAYGENAETVATHITALLLNAEKTLKDVANERYKLQPTRADRKHYRDLVDLGYEELRQRYSVHFAKNGKPTSDAPLTLSALGFFREEALDFIGAEGDQRVQRLEALTASLLEDFRVIVITLDQNDDAQVIFETLNSRGKPLAAMDLVRNDIFHRAAKARENVEQLLDDRWSIFEDPFWKKEQRQGRLKKQRMDFFLAHTLAAERGGEVAMTELYAEYKKLIKERPFVSVEAELATLTRYAPTYRALAEPADDTPLARLARRLEIFEVSSAYPAVFVIETSNAEPEEKARLYDLIASYAIRRTLCGLSTKNYTRIFNRLATTLRQDGVSVATLMRVLSEPTDDSFRFPRNDELAEAIANRRQYFGGQSQRRLRHVLEELEFASHTNLDETKGLQDALSIEHVLPDNWTTFWPLSDGTLVPEDKRSGLSTEQLAEVERRDRAKHTLGNLTLLTLPGNIQALHYEFNRKLQRLRSSLLRLNQDIAQESQWDESAIRRRAARLADLAIKIWPGPQAAP